MNLTLFPTQPVFPEGFSYLREFITPGEEIQLVEEISRLSLHTFIFQGFEAKRKVASFGHDWNFTDRKLRPGKPLPRAFDWVLNKVAAHMSDSDDFAEILVTEYPPGSVINWHRDAPPFDIIAGISLLSDAIFKLRPYDPQQRSRSSTISLPVERRSLYIMRGPSRTDWQHCIAPVKQQRYSITLRTLNTLK
jgi:alkylated DNA repair dioxygenase AlkB